MPLMTGKRALLELLKQEGVTTIFGNPGTTELPLMDALAVEDEVRYVLALEEAAAMAMADGYAQASRGLGVVNLHVAPGLGNAMGMLFSAHKSGAPVLVTAGQQAQGFGLTEPGLYAELPPIAEHFTKWATEVRSAADLPRVIHRAAKVALSPPTGPVFISLPGDVLNQEDEISLSHPTRVAPHFRGDPQAIRAAAQILASAERPMIIAGDAVAQNFAHEPLVRIAELLGAPVYLEGEATTNSYPTQHHLFRNHLVRSAAVIRGVLQQHDVLFSVGGDLFTLGMPPQDEPVPDGIRIVHLDTDAWQLGKNYHTDVAILGNPLTTLPELQQAVCDFMGPDGVTKAKIRQSAIAEEIAQTRELIAAQARAEAEKAPIAVVSAMYAIGDVLPEDAVVIDEAISSDTGLREFLKCDRADALYGCRGGGIGWALPAAIGVKLALPDRPVVALSGDGSAMYTCQALWTAAHEKVPVVFVILNNRSYRILKQRLFAMKASAAQVGRYVGMELTNPAIDFVGLARSMGVDASLVRSIPEFRHALQTALLANSPVLIEVEVERQWS